LYNVQALVSQDLGFRSSLVSRSSFESHSGQCVSICQNSVIEDQ